MTSWYSNWRGNESAIFRLRENFMSTYDDAPKTISPLQVPRLLVPGCLLTLIYLYQLSHRPCHTLRERLVPPVIFETFITRLAKGSQARNPPEVWLRTFRFFPAFPSPDNEYSFFLHELDVWNITWKFPSSRYLVNSEYFFNHLEMFTSLASEIFYKIPSPWTWNKNSI